MANGANPGIGNKPPPSPESIGAAAAIGGFGGAILGVLAAAALSGNGDDNTAQTQQPAPEAQVACVQEPEAQLAFTVTK